MNVRRTWVGSALMAMGMAFTLGLAAWAPGQTAATPPGSQTAAGPLARYVQGEGLVALLEHAGLDARESAWKQTAAYKLLNETSTGAMLEDVLAQLIDRVPGESRGSLTGADAVAVLEHVAKNGLIAGVNAPSKGAANPREANGHAVLVIRNAARKDARPIFGRFLNMMMLKAKPQIVQKGARRVVTVKTATGQDWAWWTEQDDLVLVPTARDVDMVIDTLEGKLPNAVDHATRTALAKPDGQFQPVMLAFLEPVATVKDMVETFERVGIKRLDYRYGFEGTSLMNVTRLHAPAPRKSPLTLLDQPTFDLSTLPPIPADAESFGVMSIDLARTYGEIVELAKQMGPQAARRFEEVEELVRAKTRRGLREDILAQFGPRIAYYTAPSSGPPVAVGLQVPKASVLLEIKDPVEFGKVLDELMILVNQQFEAQALAGGPPPSGDAKKDAATRKAIIGQAPRFTPIGGANKTFILRLPAQLQSMTNLNLTLAVGKKHFIIGAAADVVNKALELEGTTEGRWKPTAEQAEALARVPKGMTGLWVEDPRSTLPDVLANLPTTAQMVLAQIEAAQKGGAPSGMPGLAGVAPGAPGARGQRRGPRLAGDDSGSSSQPAAENLEDTPATGSSPDEVGPDSGGVPGQPPPGAPGGAVGGPVAATATGPLRIDPAKVPRADEIRRFLYPSTTAFVVNAAGVEYVSRSASPSIGSAATSGVLVALLLPAVQSVREAARRAQCMNNLKQIALGMMNSADKNGVLPAAAITSPDGKPLLSWRVAILPHIGQAELYKQFKLDEPWDSPNNKALLERMPATYGCPSEALAPGMTHYKVFTGPGSIFDTANRGGTKLVDIRDGTSNTLLVVEAGEPVPWTKPEDLPFGGGASPLDGVGSKHPGGLNAVFADGAVRFLSRSNLSESKLRALITRAGAEAVSP